MSGFLLILFSELGDKTFFIAVLLALKKNKGLVFAGTFGALAIMTVISVSKATTVLLKQNHSTCTSQPVPCIPYPAPHTSAPGPSPSRGTGYRVH